MENIRNRISLFWPKPLDTHIAKVKADCFTPEWLAKEDETEEVLQRFPTNGDRFAALEVFKRTNTNWYTRNGFLCQLYAAGFHHKSAAQIKKMGDAIGRERILVFHGQRDELIQFIHGEMMLRELGGEESGVTKSFPKDVGHVAPYQLRKQFKEIIADRIQKTEALAKR